MQEDDGTEQRRRRTALVVLLREQISGLLDQLIPEAVRASGLGQAIRDGYMAGAHESVDIGLRALEADDAERSALLDRLVSNIAVTSRRHHIPAIVERGLVSIGLRWAQAQVREHAPRQGFTPTDLEAEYLVFRGAFEDKYR